MLFRRLLLVGLVTLISWISVRPAFTQNEISTQRASLEGLQRFYITVNVEASPKLTEKKQLDVTQLQEQATKKLTKSGIPVKTGKTPRGQDHAMLIMHINAMDAGRGIVPFAVDVDLYQPVKLTLNRDMEHTASTWNTGNVGVVSYDNLSTIPEAALMQLDDFIKDYKAANRSVE